MSKKILVVSAHPDDEILGAGGTLIRHRESGDEIYWCIVTETREGSKYTNEFRQKRNQEIDEIKESLKIKKVFKLGFETSTLSSEGIGELIGACSQMINLVQPERIYVTNRSDAHSDHKYTFEAIYACTKSFRNKSLRELWMYECISETEFGPMFQEKAFLPNCLVDISGQLDEKINLMSIYESELGEHPFPRSEKNIRALATFRGAMAGTEAAEAFQIVKKLAVEEL